MAKMSMNQRSRVTWGCRNLTLKVQLTTFIRLGLKWTLPHFFQI